MEWKCWTVSKQIKCGTRLRLIKLSCKLAASLSENYLKNFFASENVFGTVTGTISFFLKTDGCEKAQLSPYQVHDYGIAKLCETGNLPISLLGAGGQWERMCSENNSSTTVLDTAAKKTLKHTNKKKNPSKPKRPNNNTKSK